jgi:hypothetical protein
MMGVRGLETKFEDLLDPARESLNHSPTPPPHLNPLANFNTYSRLNGSPDKCSHLVVKNTMLQYGCRVYFQKQALGFTQPVTGIALLYGDGVCFL